MGVLDDLTPEQQAEVERIREAFRGEFEESRTKSPGSGAITDLEELKTNMLAALKRALDQHDDKKLAASVAMWGYGKLIDQNKATADPLTDLLEGADAVVARSGTTRTKKAK
jgi:hypothetical protein